MATTFAGLQGQVARGLIVAVDIVVGELLTSWTKTAGQTDVYQDTPATSTLHGPKTFTVVRQDGTTTLASVADVATVDSTAGSYYWDGTILYVHMTDSSPVYSHTIVADFTLYVCSGSDDGSPVVLSGNLYWPFLAGVETITRRLDVLHNAQIVTSGTRLRLTSGGEWRNLYRTYRWANRSAIIRLGGEDLAIGEYQTVMTGVVRNHQWDDAGIALEVTDATTELDRAFPSAVFTAADASTTYTMRLQAHPSRTTSQRAIDVEATAATTRIPIGAPKPILYGGPAWIAPVALGLSGGNGLYMVANHKIGGISKLHVDGVEVAWDDTTVERFFVDLDLGIMYISGAAATLADVDVYVEVYGVPDDTYRHTEWTENRGGLHFIAQDNPADIVKDMVEVKAALSHDMDATATAESRYLASLYEYSVYLTTAGTLRAVINEIASHTGAHFFHDSDGDYVYRVWTPDYRASTEIDEARGEFLSFTAEVDNTDLFPAVAVAWGLLTEAAFDLDVTGFSHSENTPESEAESVTERALTISGGGLRTEAGAVCLALRLARWGSANSQRIQTGLTIRHANLLLGGPVEITRVHKPTESDTNTVYAEVIGMGFDLAEGRIDAVLDEMRGLHRQAFLGPAASPVWGSASENQRRLVGYFTDDVGAAAASDSRAYRPSLEW